MATIAKHMNPEERRAVRQAVLQEQEEGRRYLYAPLDFSEGAAEHAATKELGSDWLKFKGYANVGELDRYGEITEPSAFKKAVKVFLATNRVMLWMHDPWTPIGRYTFGEVINAQAKAAIKNVGGLYVEGGLMPPTDKQGMEHAGSDWQRYIRSLVEHQVVLSLSVGYLPKASKREKIEIDGKERDVRIVTDLDLLEISLVSIPASQRSQITSKSIAPILGEKLAELLCIDGECNLEAPKDPPAQKFEPCDGLRAFVAQQVDDAIQTKEADGAEAQADDPDEVELVELASLEPVQLVDLDGKETQQ